MAGRKTRNEEDYFGARRPGRNSPPFRHVYFIEAEGRDLVKIGCADDAEKRLRTLQIGSPDRLVLRGVYHTDDAVEFEGRLHLRFKHLHVRGEWFRVDDQMLETMADLFTVEESHLRICLRPQPPSSDRQADIYWQPGDTPKSFALRVCKVAEACGLEVEYDLAA